MSRSVSFGILFVLLSSNIHAGEEKTWEGKWSNKKYGTSGPLKCVATEGENGTWKATFSGKFQGEGFSYDAEFDSKPGKNQTDLSGKANVRGHDYEWTGSIKGKQLKGKYTSSVGYFGEFTLTEPKKKK
jgi:hypothetical protein